MAKASVQTKTVKVTKTVEVDEVTEEFTLVLNFREASLIRACLGSALDTSVANDEAEALRKALRDVGIEYGNSAFYGNEYEIVTSQYFLD